MLKLAVLISGGGTNLQAIIDACESGIISGQVTLVISNKAGVYGLERAHKHGIESLVMRDDQEILQALQAREIDLIILAGYLRKISPNLIAAYPNRIMNIHPSLIPAFSGKGFYGIRVHEAVIARGCQYTGVTTHIVNQDLDEGRILMQAVVEVQAEDTPESLQERVLAVEHQLIVQSINKLIGEINNESTDFSL